MKKLDVDTFLSSLNRKKILVLGLGIQGGGLGVVRFLLRRGAKVVVYDDRDAANLTASLDALSKEEGIEYLLAGRMPQNIKDYDLVVKGPSVKWSHPVVALAQRESVHVTMEAALFVLYAPSRIIGITGTRGKSTTTMMVYNTLKEIYKEGRVYASGNLPGTCSLDLLDKLTKNDITILELSSWQLSGFHHEKCSPEIAVLTTLYEDHLNYYTSMRDYIYDKTAIYAYQDNNGKIIISKPFAQDYFKVLKPSHNNISYIDANNFKNALTSLRGLHNVLNASLAKEACKSVITAIDDLSLEKFIASQKSITCRQEYIGTYKNVEIINDSASTTPASVMAALDTFTDKDVVLLLGGQSKNLPYNNLVNKLKEKKHKIRYVVLLKGTFTDEILPELSAIQDLHLVGVVEHFRNAVTEGLKLCTENSKPVYLLFSPGATSFAEFKNEFHRGEEFVNAVSDIINK